MWPSEKHNLGDYSLFHPEGDPIDQDLEYQQVTIPFVSVGYESPEQTSRPIDLIPYNCFPNLDRESCRRTSPELAVTNVNPILLTALDHPTNVPGCNGTQAISNQGVHTTRRTGVLDLQKRMQKYPTITGDGTPARNRNLCKGRKITERNTGREYSTKYRCEWAGCRYTGVFGRKEDLKRHIFKIHVSPRSYECPVGNCRRAFNRNDNLQSHLKRVHPVPWG
ncbi:hypothetical protein ABOM_006339 [Aspergillus bombycis]|uniref:C2H2-type domain-containing protein n=1 Tax=Aspergillus bombycis TaxID=109264 RepID=A0A1F8A2A3_9EURO|nr:hypothetical protein ABOM_006339 [Aspergillus bombycis]OGM45475.1 hypothetical protein ABOM_006339 [Aspergillus bombycis]